MHTVRCVSECVREDLVRRQSREGFLPGVMPEAHTPISWAHCPLLQTQPTPAPSFLTTSGLGTPSLLSRVAEGAVGTGATI